MKKILIVDDSTFTRDIHKKMIAKEGYEVVEASGGAEAVAVYEKEKPDLVMIDLLMPDIDGMDAIGMILEKDPKAKIAVCSTDKQKARQEDAKELGILAFLTKPLSTEKVKEVLHKIFDNG